MTQMPPVDALLVLDVGNTRIGLGIWDADGLHDVQRVLVREPQTWRPALEQPRRALAGREVVRAVVGSVSSEPLRQFVTLVEDALQMTPLRVRADIPLPMRLQVEAPEEVGVDRICSAAAAFERVQDTCAVASFGTAITIDCVSPDGQFLGGTILPGLEMSCAALHERTAALPHVVLTAPSGPFGRNTREAITNGVVYAAAGALREIVERFATELRVWPQLVITGGNADLIAAEADFVDAVVPDLCLMGIALAYRRAAGQA